VAGAEAQPIAAQFLNAPFLNDLLSVLNHPTSAQAPDLKHFRMDSAAVARARAEVAAANRSQRSALPAGLLLAAVWLGALAASVGLWRAGPLLPAWLWRTGVLAVPVVLASVSAGVHVQPPRPALESHVLSATSAPPPIAAAPPTAMAHPTWLELISVETELWRHHDALKRQEDRIRLVAVSPSDLEPVPVGDASPETLDRTLRMDREAKDQRRLAQMLDTYQQMSARYRETLKREYELYRGAVQDPSRKQQLVEAAAAAPRPEIRDAVAYNLTAIQTQLEQEAAIHAAEAKLRAIGSLSAAQLGAMRRHQPFIIPLEGPITQGFGPSDLSFEPTVNYRGTYYPRFHTGIDISAPENTPVHAAADGVVVLAASSRDSKGHYTGYGNYVVIAHPDGFTTLYGHLNSFSVREGDVVHQGQIIGQEGSTGMSTGPHVHFEIRHNGEWVDPMPYLTGKAST
jgi:murein DD-endopeptidase MepM/ murein hydrolase activator NlpD